MFLKLVPTFPIDVFKLLALFLTLSITSLNLSCNDVLDFTSLDKSFVLLDKFTILVINVFVGERKLDIAFVTDFKIPPSPLELLAIASLTFSVLLNTLSKIQKPLILRGANNDSVDLKLLPLLAEFAPKECIISFAQESTYEQIVPIVAKYNHILVLRSPIDINLAKELNILSIDKGMHPDRILIDPDMGGLGYGLDYGYSIIEKIRQAAFDGDTMLNMPVIAFIGEESYRAKEAKSDTFSAQWGDYKERAAMWEIAGASAMISAGADIVVLWNPKSVEAITSLLRGG